MNTHCFNGGWNLRGFRNPKFTTNKNFSRPLFGRSWLTLPSSGDDGRKKSPVIQDWQGYENGCFPGNRWIGSMHFGMEFFSKFGELVVFFTNNDLVISVNWCFYRQIFLGLNYSPSNWNARNVEYLATSICFFLGECHFKHHRLFWGAKFPLNLAPSKIKLQVLSPNTSREFYYTKKWKTGGEGTMTGWWQLKYFLFSSRSLGKWSNLTGIFFRRVVQPPTRFRLVKWIEMELVVLPFKRWWFGNPSPSNALFCFLHQLAIMSDFSLFGWYNLPVSGHFHPPAPAGVDVDSPAQGGWH